MITNDDTPLGYSRPPLVVPLEKAAAHRYHRNMATSPDIRTYNDALQSEDREMADALLAVISRELRDAESKVWHAHPVWFLDGNPIVGYDRLKDSFRLFFWSGQSFDEPGLDPSGTFKAAEKRYTHVSQIDESEVTRWLAEAREYQWNYRDIRRNRGLVALTENLADA